MKTYFQYIVLLFITSAGFLSCEGEQFSTCPEIELTIENESGSAVYRFIAALEHLEDAQFTWSVNGEEVGEGDIASVSNQILEYRFEPGSHTVCINASLEGCALQACRTIEVVRDENDPCPDLFFTTEARTASTYKFIADFEGITTTDYEWFINNEQVEDINQEYLMWNFRTAGTYEVCLRAETPECPNRVSYCREVVIETIETACPQLFFEAEQDGDNPAYYFHADFEEIATTSYEWFIDGELIEAEFTGANGTKDDQLYYQFNPGTYEICIMAETPDCPNGISYCKQILVNAPGSECPELFFEAEQDGDNPAYYFYADFEGIATTSYEWFIDGELIEAEFTGANGTKDDELYYQFSPGTYEICIMAETPDCPNGITFCKQIIVE